MSASRRLDRRLRVLPAAVMLAGLLTTSMALAQDVALRPLPAAPAGQASLMPVTVGGTVLITRPGGGAVLGGQRRVVSVAGYPIGCFWMLQDPERQMWHDKIAGTVVLNAEGPRAVVMVLPDLRTGSERFFQTDTFR
jgi:hypothetical protein